LRLGVRTIKKERYDLFEYFLADIDRAVDAIARFHPIYFANRNLPRQSFSAITELDIEQIPAQNHSHAVKRIMVPRCGLARRQPLPPNQIISAMMQDLLICHKAYSLSLSALCDRSRNLFVRNHLHIKENCKFHFGFPLLNALRTF